MARRRSLRQSSQAYLDKLDGKIDDEFWAQCSAQWQAEKARTMEELARHGQADSAYLNEGARLVEVASRAVDLYRRHGLVERRGFLASILQNVRLKDGRITADYRPAFNILARMAAENSAPPSVPWQKPEEFKSIGMGWLAVCGFTT